MNPAYFSPKGAANKGPTTTLFPHQKDKNASFQPTSSHSKLQNIPLTVSPLQTSKNFIAKPTLQLLKSNSTTATFPKPTNQVTGFQPKISVTAPSKSSTEIPKNILQNVPKQKDMTSSGKDFGADKQTVATIGARRQPRYSEPAQLESPYQSTQDVKTSFAYSKSNVQQQQTDVPIRHFYKKQTVLQPEVSKQNKSESKRDWLKQYSRGRKGTRELDDFEMIKTLGKGKYGSVYLVRDKKSGFCCALKVVEKALIRQQNIVEQFTREVKIQMLLNHPHIIKMYGCFDDEKNIYVILEVVTGGQLFHMLRKNQPMSEGKAAGLMKQICSAVDQLHCLRIIHRDIKPENIVMHEGIPKLCDFGWSVHLDNKMRNTFCGTPLYVCPEILKGNQYDEKIDIWSLGIMTYEMLVGENPFKINKQEELIKIVKEEISIPSYVYVSKQARDFLDKCLQKNPTNRVNIKELINHEFILKNAEKGDKKITL